LQFVGLGVVHDLVENDRAVSAGGRNEENGAGHQGNESGAGVPQSKTWRIFESVRIWRKLLECGVITPLFGSKFEYRFHL
jgi:hypothetical protein